MARKKKEKVDRSGESKQDALRRIGGPRVEKALKAIGRVSKLARYSPTAAQQKAIVGALNSAVEAVSNRFAGATEPTEAFELP